MSYPVTSKVHSSDINLNENRKLEQLVGTGVVEWILRNEIKILLVTLIFFSFLEILDLGFNRLVSFCRDYGNLT